MDPLLQDRGPQGVGNDSDQEDLEHHQILAILLKTIQHFFTDVSLLFHGVRDPRDPSKIRYPLEALLFAGVLMFLCRLGARRQIALQFRGGRSLDRMRALFGVEGFPHGDTLNDAFSKLDVDEAQEVVTRMPERLIRSKVLDPYRIHGRFMVALDGTGVHTFQERHCPNCLTAKHGKVTIYYHNVLEAKLVTEDGFCFPLMTEFIENESPDVSTQDCELKAFYRLAERLKKRFRRLGLWLTLDGLFAGAPTFALCENLSFKFTIVLKEGDLRAVYQEFTELANLAPENHLTVRIGKGGRIQQQFRWVNGITYVPDRGRRSYTVCVLECLETIPDTRRPGGTRTTRFLWVTNVEVTERNVREVATSGRIRWKIENEGFNAQKTGGFALEHAYSMNPVASKVFHFLLQIAHMLFQLLERGSLLKKTFPKGFGSLRNLARRILDAWRYAREMTRESLCRLLSKRIQIRFDTS